MTATLASTVTAQVPQLWDSLLLAQAENRTFWKKFEGPEGSSSAIIRKDDLTKTAGDTIKMDMVLALTSSFITGDTTALVGNEEALKFRQNSVTVTALADAVRWSELVEATINYDMRSTALNQMQKHLAEKLDNDIWSELTGGGTTIPAVNEWYAGVATSVNTLVNTAGNGAMTLSDVSDARAYAQATLKIEPMMTDGGEEYYGLVLDPYAALALKKDSNYQTAFRDAQVRGDNNPLFTGSLGFWDGVILYSNNNVPSGTTAFASPATVNIRYAKNVLFGAQACARGFAQYPDWREELFDYGRQAGIATTLIKGDKVFLYDLSAAGDASGNQCLGHIVLNSAAVAPVA